LIYLFIYLFIERMAGGVCRHCCCSFLWYLPGALHV